MSQLNVEVREGGGKGVARKLRAQGQIPGVLYGLGKEPVSLALSPRPLLKLLETEGRNALIELEGKLGRRTALVRELQMDPVKGAPIHVDFLEINRDVAIEVEVGIHLVGTPVGVELEGGVLDHQLREIEIECLPGAIPDAIEVDVSGLHIGDSIHVGELRVPAGVEVLTEADVSVVSVVAPAREEEPVAAAPEGAEVPIVGEEGADEAAPKDEDEKS